MKDIEWNRYGILENKISETILKCNRLKDENADLKQQIEWGVQEQEEEEKEGKELNTEEDNELEQENVKSGFCFEIGERVIVHDEVPFNPKPVPIDTLGEVISI